jgi:hypothetical protein
MRAAQTYYLYRILVPNGRAYIGITVYPEQRFAEENRSLNLHGAGRVWSRPFSGTADTWRDSARPSTNEDG